MFGVLRPGSPNRERVPVHPSSSPPPLRSLAPMPASDFASREDLLVGVKDWAASQGYAVVIARSRFNRLWLKCDRGGTYENRRNLTPDQRKRKRGDSRLLGCPFRMLATAKKDGTWKVETDNPEHNHEPSEDLSQHPTLRRMTDEQLHRVHEMCDRGNSPSETIEELRRLWPDIKVLTRDIYNARKKYKTQKELAEAAAGAPPPQPYQDPNGLIPGPDNKGRWAWVPEGEEVTSKKSRRRRRTLPPPQPALDPQLRNSNSHTPQQAMSAANQQLLRDFRNGLDQSSFSHPPFGSHDSAPRTIHHGSTSDPMVNGSYLPQPQQYDQLNGPHSRLPSQTPSHPATTAHMSTTPSHPEHTANGAGSASSKPASGQVLMSRIERMEKEQRDQKNMLAQILGAVQGMSGNPG